MIDSTPGQTFDRFTTFLTPGHVLFGKKEHPSQQNRRYFLGVIYRKGFILVPRNNSFRAVRKIRFCFSSNNLFAICGREKQRTDISDDLAFYLDLVLIFNKNQLIWPYQHQISSFKPWQRSQKKVNTFEIPRFPSKTFSDKSQHPF